MGLWTSQIFTGRRILILKLLLLPAVMLNLFKEAAFILKAAF